MNLPTSPAEHFKFLRFGFDVSECEAAIAAGAITTREDSFPREFIQAYAENLLALTQDVSEPVSRGLISVDVPYARALGPTAQAAPVLMVEHEFGLLVLEGKRYFIVNGNHRMAQAYFENAASIRVLVVDQQAAAPYLN